MIYDRIKQKKEREVIMKYTTFNIYTGRSQEREVITRHKNSITLAIPEFRTGKAKYYFRPTLDTYYNEYLKEKILK